MAKNVTITLGGSVAEEGKPGSRHLIRVIHLIGLDIIIYNDIQKINFIFYFFVLETVLRKERCHSFELPIDDSFHVILKLLKNHVNQFCLGLIG